MSASAPGLHRMRSPWGGPTVHSGVTRGGARVHVARMPGFSGVSASLTVRYGSTDTHLPDGTRLPAGTAHFLEHAMFQVEGRDVCDVFAARGASANAYTTFSSTSYVFTCTDHVEENLRTLMETLRRMDADDTVVERERRIIGQEIAMYADDPSWRGYFNLLQGLYVSHPVREDIAGSDDSIAGVDREVLRRAHDAYYRPRNLLLVVTGDVEPARVMGLADEILKGPRGAKRGPRSVEARPGRVRRARVEESLSVSRPYVFLGLKERPPGRGRRLADHHVLTALALDLLFGDGGRIEAPLYRMGIVDDSLAAGVEVEADYAHSVISAEVDDVEAFRRRLLEGLRASARVPVSEAELTRVRRKARGQHLRVFNSPEATAYWLLGQALDDLALDARMQALERATPRAVTRRLEALAAAPRTWSIVRPAIPGSALAP